MKAKLIKNKDSIKTLVVVFLLPVVLIAVYGFAAKTYLAQIDPSVASIASSVSD